MNFIDKKQKLDYLIVLITNEHTGSADELSKNICVSKPTLMRYLSDLRKLDNTIGYCRYRRSYYFIKMKQTQ